MTDEEMYPPVTRIYWHGDTSSMQVAFGAFETISNAVRDSRTWLECEDENGCPVLLHLQGVQLVMQLTTEQRVLLEERLSAQALRFPR